MLSWEVIGLIGSGRDLGCGTYAKRALLKTHKHRLQPEIQPNTTVNKDEFTSFETKPRQIGSIGRLLWRARAFGVGWSHGSVFSREFTGSKGHAGPQIGQELDEGGLQGSHSG